MFVKALVSVSAQTHLKFNIFWTFGDASFCFHFCLSEYHRYEIEELSKSMSFLTFRSGDQILEEGEDSSFFGILLSGRLEVFY